MSNQESGIDVPQLIHELADGERQHVQQLWESYFERLVTLSNAKLPSKLKRICDGEDIALSALNSFIRGAENQRYPDLRDAADLWSLLVVISDRKLCYRIRAAKRLKRGGGKVRGESVFLTPGQDDDAISGLQSFFSAGPSVEDVVEIAERTERLLQYLDGNEFRHVVELKLQGYSHEEIAGRLDVSVRTVHRRLVMVRHVWSEIAEQEAAAEQASYDRPKGMQ